MGRFVGHAPNRGKGTGGGGSGDIIVTTPYSRSSGLVTFTSSIDNKVQTVTLGENAYNEIQYNNVGLITGFNEKIGDNVKGWIMTYDSNNLCQTIVERDSEHPPQPLFTVTSNMYTVDENSTPVIKVDTVNVPAGTQLYWDSSSDADLTTASLSAALSTVGQFATDQAQVQVEFLQDSITEGVETINFRVYTDAAKTILVGTSPNITINDTSVDSAGDGQSQATAVNVTDHWSIFLFDKTVSDDGKYWMTVNGGSPFKTWVTFRDGGWIKIAQMNGNADIMNPSEALNAEGSWIDSYINTNQHGKLPTSIIDDLSHQNFLLSVTGSPSDAFLNSRQGAMVFKYINSETLPNWGTSQDPSGTYDLCLDAYLTGSGYEILRYQYESRTLCSNDGNHGGNGSYWVSDHNYNGSWQQQRWGSSGAPICWTISQTRIHTNQHWMGGPAGGSGSNQQWGNSGSNAVAFYVQPQSSGNTANSGIDINSSGLQHYWNAISSRYNGSGTILDSTGSGNNLSIGWDSPTYSSSTRGGELIESTNDSNGFFYFTNGDVTYGNGYTSNAFTFFWCGEKSEGPWWMLATGRDGNNFIGWDGGTCRLDSNQDVKGDLSYSGFSNNTLECLYMTIDSSGSMAWYRNGSQVGTNTYSGSWSSHNVIFDTLGKYDTGGSYQTGGKFYFAGFYDRALSASEVSSNWTAHQTRLGI